MHFTHRPYIPGETIAAIATPPGEGGVAIIRISGDDAIIVGQKIFSRSLKNTPSHTVKYGHVIDSSGKRIDDVLAIPMLGKRSFTGENTLEIHCHGGALISRRILELALNAGARPAGPGEFSFKAFINGKIDLSQAEAIAELIAAKNEIAVDAAEAQLEGKLSEKIKDFQEQLTEIAAVLEARVDFPDEGLEFSEEEVIIADIAAISDKIKNLIDTFQNGRMIHEGLAICLVGSPNVGKSSLMNALLDKNRAIVSSVPGTTRDILEDDMRLNGINIRLIDTAGIRETTEEIEAEGIRRTHSAIADADLVLLVLDANKGIGEEEKNLIAKMPEAKTVTIFNKIDLIKGDFDPKDFPHPVKISALNKWGLEDLTKKIDEVIWEKGPPSKEEIIITNIRHKNALQKAHESCERLTEGLIQGISPEFLTPDIRNALYELGSIIGTNVSEDILSAIFSKFCIGK